MVASGNTNLEAAGIPACCGALSTDIWNCGPKHRARTVADRILGDARQVHDPGAGSRIMYPGFATWDL